MTIVESLTAKYDLEKLIPNFRKKVESSLEEKGCYDIIAAFADEGKSIDPHVLGFLICKWAEKQGLFYKMSVVTEKEIYVSIYLMEEYMNEKQSDTDRNDIESSPYRWIFI